MGRNLATIWTAHRNDLGNDTRLSDLRQVSVQTARQGNDDSRLDDDEHDDGVVRIVDGGIQPRKGSGLPRRGPYRRRRRRSSRSNRRANHSVERRRVPDRSAAGVSTAAHLSGKQRNVACFHSTLAFGLRVDVHDLIRY